MGRDFSKFSIMSIYVYLKHVLIDPGGLMYMCWII